MQEIIAVDSQKLEHIQACMYLYKMNFGTPEISGIQPLVTPDYYERGGLVHKMLDPYYVLRKHRGRWAQNRKTYADVVQSCMTIGRHAAVRMDLDIADVEMCVQAFQQYCTHWENDGWDDVVGVEQTGSKILYESPDLIILYEVKIDLILRMCGQLFPVDHKTAKARRDPNEMSNQFKGYCWFLGVNSLIVNEIGFQKTLKPVEKFIRHTLTFSQDCLDEWVEDSVWWLRHAHELIKQNKYPRNPTSCNKYSGCVYKEICTADREVREYKIQSRFKPKKWDVGQENL